MSLVNSAMVAMMPVLPKQLVGLFAKRYIAGDSLDDAVEKVKEFNSNNICATLDILGEHINSIDEASPVVEDYLEVLDRINSEGLDSNISIKPTQFGLQLDKEKCYQNFVKVLDRAAELDNFVRIDMEDASCTDSTLELLKKLQESYNNVGVVLQAYLRRTIDDVVKHANSKSNYRLCKGIYVEKREIAYKDMNIINENFSFLLREMFKRKSYVGIATHDEKLVWEATKIIYEMNIPKDKYEFQMLLGVDEELRNIIVSAGHKLRVYVPFGKDWYAYSTRRLKENPAIAGHILKNLLR